MRIRAAVLSAPRTPLAVEEVELAAPGAGEVLVRYRASGVCHSDLHVVDGDWARPMPVVAGHEGAGVVEAVGPGVEHVRPGDHTVLTWVYPCGSCALCARGRSWLCERSSAGRHVLADGTTRVSRPDGTPLYQYLAVGSLAEAAVVPAAACVPVPAELPFDVAALIGCGVATGVGAVVNTARVPAGSAVCVVGCGGVGLSTVMGAALAGADPIVAVDLSPASLALAAEVGATHLVDAEGGWATEVRKLTGGVEYGFDCIGAPAVVGSLLVTLLPGGTVVLVGMTAQGVSVPIDGYRVPDRGYSLLGSSYGSCVAAVDFPRLARLHLAGRLPLDRLVTRRIVLDGVNDALESMRRREGGRSVVMM
jgi:S-(hydroxymethyl)glutathione dehydrogenase/alcohol dehydrogenase